MGRYSAKISSISDPIGNPPYLLTLSPGDDVATKKYKTKEGLIGDLIECAGASPNGCAEILDQLTYKPFIICPVDLTDDGVTRLTGTGWEE